MKNLMKPMMKQPEPTAENADVLARGESATSITPKRQ
jgi:hypothetical protein